MISRLRCSRTGQRSGESWPGSYRTCRSFPCLPSRAAVSATYRALADAPLGLPVQAREVFRVEGLSGHECGDHFYLTEGTSLLHLQRSQGQGTAQLVPAFAQQPQLLRHQFWAVGLVKLLRPLGLYGLHAAGLVTPPDGGMLLVGGSGSGKSTLTIGLVRQGCGYLSDDALLLRPQPEGVEALAFRKPFSIDAEWPRPIVTSP